MWEYRGALEIGENRDPLGILIKEHQNNSDKNDRAKLHDGHPVFVDAGISLAMSGENAVTS